MAREDKGGAHTHRGSGGLLLASLPPPSRLARRDLNVLKSGVLANTCGMSSVVLRMQRPMLAHPASKGRKQHQPHRASYGAKARRPS